MNPSAKSAWSAPSTCRPRMLMPPSSVDRLAGDERGSVDPADAIEQRAQGICGLDVFFVGRIDSVEHGGDWEGLRRGIRLADPSGICESGSSAVPIAATGPPSTSAPGSVDSAGPSIVSSASRNLAPSSSSPESCHGSRPVHTTGRCGPRPGRRCEGPAWTRCGMISRTDPNSRGTTRPGRRARTNGPPRHRGCGRR